MGTGADGLRKTIQEERTWESASASSSLSSGLSDSPPDEARSSMSSSLASPNEFRLSRPLDVSFRNLNDDGVCCSSMLFHRALLSRLLNSRNLPSAQPIDTETKTRSGATEAM